MVFIEKIENSLSYRLTLLCFNKGKDFSVFSLLIHSIFMLLSFIISLLSRSVSFNLLIVFFFLITLFIFELSFTVIHRNDTRNKV